MSEESFRFKVSDTKRIENVPVDLITIAEWIKFLKTPIKSIECVSCELNKTVYSYGKKNVSMHPFMQAACIAYNGHVPLVLKPDVIWMTILQGFAADVNKKSENYRKLFVSHDGKKIIKLINPKVSPGCKSKDKWESVISEFTNNISGLTTENSKLICMDFTTSTKNDKIVGNIILMDAMKKYFDYKMQNLCGIPEIIIQGSVDDWIKIKERSIKLKEIGYQIGNDLISVLDKIIDTVKDKKADLEFWKDFFQLLSYGSGGTMLTGHIRVFFSDAIKEDGSYKQVEYDNINNVISSVPVEWDYFGKIINIRIEGGFVGCTINEKYGAVCPNVEWWIYEVLPEKPVRESAHYGIRCDGCQKRNWNGKRFRCIYHEDNGGYDLCGDCYANRTDMHNEDCEFVEYPEKKRVKLMRIRKEKYGKNWNQNHIFDDPKETDHSRETGGWGDCKNNSQENGGWGYSKDYSRENYGDIFDF